MHTHLSKTATSRNRSDTKSLPNYSRETKNKNNDIRRQSSHSGQDSRVINRWKNNKKFNHPKIFTCSRCESASSVFFVVSCGFYHFRVSFSRTSILFQWPGLDGVYSAPRRLVTSFQNKCDVGHVTHISYTYVCMHIYYCLRTATMQSIKIVKKHPL